MDQLLFLFEITGTVAFAISGAASGVHSGMDLFGVIVQGVITATAGGIFRDMILGVFPPLTFRNPLNVTLSALTSLIVFLSFAYVKKSNKKVHWEKYRHVLLLSDSLGLAVFTISGMDKAMVLYGHQNGFLIIFSGVITGVGGGVLRDIMSLNKPMIFRKQIYASASIVGALLAWVLFFEGEVVASELLGAAVIILIRLLAAYYRWSLPKLE